MSRSTSDKNAAKPNDSIKKKTETLDYAQRINYTLYEIATAVSTTRNLEHLYHSIYQSLNKLIRLPNFYIALYNRQKKTIRFEYFVDEFDNDLPIVKNPDTPKSLTQEVILACRPLFLKENMLLERARKNRLIGATPKIWIGVPLIRQDKVIGVIATQHYTDAEYFSHQHLELLISVSEQITIAIERKQINNAFEKEKKILRRIIDNTRSIVAMITPDGMYKFVNPAHKKLGYDIDQLPGTSFFEQIHPEDMAIFLPFLEKGIAGRASHITTELKIRYQSGDYKPVKARFELIKNQDGHLETLIFIGEEIVEHNALKEKNILGRSGDSTKSIDRVTAHDCDNYLSRIQADLEQLNENSHNFSNSQKKNLSNAMISLKKVVERIRQSTPLTGGNKDFLEPEDPFKVSQKTKQTSDNTDDEQKAKTVLVIDDEDMVRDMAVKALQAFGYNAIDAPDGKKGVAVYQKNRNLIDAVLLDIIMPKMSGVETFRRLLMINPNVKVIIASGHITNQDQKKLFAKASGYLDKPYQIMELKQALQNILN